MRNPPGEVAADILVQRILCDCRWILSFVLNQIGEIFPLLACNQQFGEVRDIVELTYSQTPVRTFSAVRNECSSNQNLAESILDRQAVVPLRIVSQAGMLPQRPSLHPPTRVLEPNSSGKLSDVLCYVTHIKTARWMRSLPDPQNRGTMTV